MGPPITYMLDGKQYVAFLGGQGIVLPPLPNAPPPGAGGRARQCAGRPNGSTEAVDFVLDGKGMLP